MNESTEELELKQMELLENQTKVFGDIQHKRCGNCSEFPECGLLRYLNDRIDYTNVYNGTMGTDKQIPRYGESWMCGTHTWKTEIVEEIQ